MPRSARDIQLIELKDTISKLNELIMTQTKSMDSLQKTIEDLRQELSNKQAEVDYLKAKLFGSSSEKLKSPFPGQTSLALKSGVAPWHTGRSTALKTILHQ